MLSKEQLEVISKLGDGGYLNYLSDGSFAEMATELLSLREQLAELKALDPIGQIIFGSYGSDGIREASVVCLHDEADWDNFQDGTLLYLEAKPAEDKC
ncbi:hypothetical protein [Yersinia rochesterensis]|uniref:hypothetical protein n=1 Tax=Yersinia rochesterensis TaxID=1604335 RepID=UPI0011AB0DD8|nr:hypothetical protein [Yersinia rochesterensis]